MNVNIEISARHVHLAKEDFVKLFGSAAALNKIRDLSVIGEFLSDKTVTILGPKKNIEKVAVLGPFRKKTQAEISRTDCFVLGIKNVPVRLSGDLENSAPIKLVGENGEISLPEGMIVAKRHLHISKTDAVKYGLKNGETVNIAAGGVRGVTFGNAIVRISNICGPTVHLDTDEGNAVDGISDGICTK
jgi:putative phosphotransacetylase